MYVSNDRINSFLQFCRDEIDAEPQSAPCDPASCGKMLAWLHAQCAVFASVESRATSEQLNAKEAMRREISGGLLSHMRGPAPQSVTAPAASDNEVPV